MEKETRVSVRITACALFGAIVVGLPIGYLILQGYSISIFGIIVVWILITGIRYSTFYGRKKTSDIGSKV
ncbi:hypothetical protein HY967_02755 [Candidatus Jorgensenbacteria bacterium]|nr:hypothetical protein [Candidatus Jorgensenbacteria bacterium]